MTGSYKENSYVCDFVFDVEIEEREEQVYKSDNEGDYSDSEGGYVLAPAVRLAPVMKSFRSGTHDIALDHSVKVKLKRYYYRLKVSVVKTWLAVGDAGDVGIKASAGNLVSGGTFGIVGDDSVRYICTRELANLVRSECKLWRATQMFEGFGPWKKVPSSWNLDQATENIDEDEESESGS